MRWERDCSSLYESEPLLAILSLAREALSEVLMRAHTSEV
jgi:hypothetical protein